MSVETWVKPYLSVSGLLAVVGMACVLKLRSIKAVSARLSEKFGKLWLAAEVLLFVLVGAAVDIRYTMGAGLAAVFMIFTALLFRTVGVLLCLVGTELNWKERLFCVICQRQRFRPQLGPCQWLWDFPVVRLCFPWRSWLF